MPGTELTVDVGNASPSIAALTFGAAAPNYTVEGTGSGALQMNDGAGTATITVSAGTQEISARSSWPAIR